jgi:hypothetical protein
MMRSDRAVVTGAAQPAGQHSRANHRRLKQEQCEQTEERRRPPGHCIYEIASARHIRQRFSLFEQPMYVYMIRQYCVPDGSRRGHDQACPQRGCSSCEPAASVAN